ncbi:hypothetical protein [Fodinicurvata sp. EGI_FJ10296]|uniref:hypothetical protein n=1 Tax=Fodinicurvata sp. EGI_FJ10296 TaxID=3231908 RepID=UPI0034535D15
MTTMVMISPTGSKVADQIRDWASRYPVKELAADLSRVMGHTVEPRTIKAWRDGATSPNVRHLEALATLHGEAFIHHIFAPLLEESDADLGMRLDRLAADADRMAGEVRSLRREIDADHQTTRAAGRGTADGRSCGAVAAQGEALAIPRSRAARGVKATAVVLSFLAVTVSLTNDSEMLRAQGRYGGRPPAARTVRAGREV